MSRNIKPSQLKDGSRQQKKNEIRTQKSQGRANNVLKGIRKLNRTKTMAKTNSSMSEKQIAEALLFTLGITYTGKKSNYSLKESQTDEDTVVNPNIIDRDYWSNLKNKNIKTKDKFPDRDDPFYKQDGGISRKDRSKRERIIEKERPSLVRIASDVVTLNTGNRSAVGVIDGLIGILLPTFESTVAAGIIDKIKSNLSDSDTGSSFTAVLNRIGRDSQIMTDNRRVVTTTDGLSDSASPLIEKLNYFVAT
jgi:hypothetical protein